MAHIGFDWLVLDTEHSPIDLTTAVHCLQAISTTSTSPMVRVAWNDPILIKRALDAGAYGLVVPMVNTREEAERAVRATRYPPQGDRSVGGVRPRLYGGADYVEHANEEILLVVQIEHIEAVRNAREILSTPGVDAYFVGPNDLASSMGLQGTPFLQDPRFQEALASVLRVARELGVPAGIHTYDAAAARQRIEEGYQFIALSSDWRLLTAKAQEQWQALGLS